MPDSTAPAKKPSASAAAPAPRKVRFNVGTQYQVLDVVVNLIVVPASEADVESTGVLAFDVPQLEEPVDEHQQGAEIVQSFTAGR